MAVYNGGGQIIASGATGSSVYAGPNESSLWLTGISSGYVPNPGITPSTPSPNPGLAPSGVGSGQSGDLSGSPSGAGCTGCKPAPNTPGSDGAKCGCVVADVRIRMFDGGCKLASEIEIGDELVAISSSLEIGREIVVQVFSLVQPILRITHDGGDLYCSTTHRLVLADWNDLPVEQLKIGDRLVASDGSTKEILSIVPFGETKVYGWTCEPTHVFIAAGLLNHNKSQDPAKKA